MSEIVLIDYTNWKGKRSKREIRPRYFFFGENEWHKPEQWLLEAYCFEAEDTRVFAMNGIHSWEPVKSDVYEKAKAEAKERLKDHKSIFDTLTTDQAKEIAESNEPATAGHMFRYSW